MFDYTAQQVEQLSNAKNDSSFENDKEKEARLNLQKEISQHFEDNRIQKYI